MLFACHPTMNKKLLSILLSASLVASSASLFAHAAPAPIESFDTAAEELPVDDITNTPSTEEASENDGPEANLCFDTAIEQNTEFSSPDIINTASLSADILHGLGTEESPFLISNADELLLFSAKVNQGITAGAYFELTADIDLGGAEWTPIGHLASSNDYSKTFHGVFDGAGFTVSNFKITTDTTNYLGFFGFLYEGEVKNLNLDNVTINVKSTTSQKIYAGILAGRAVTVNGNSSGRAEISNCNITNSSLTLQSGGELYAGGLIGSAIAGSFNGESSIVISMCDVDCDVDAKSTSVNRVNIALGGLVGYLGSEKNASMKVLNCNSFGSITSECTITSVITPIAGGVFGLVMTFDAKTATLGGKMEISSCHSEGDLVVKSVSTVYAAGFAGQISASDLTTIKDCYSSSNVSGSSSGVYSVLGGFMGMTDYYNSLPEQENNTIFNCYSAGDVIDIICNGGKPVESYVGAFVGYTAFDLFKNCYKLESQTVVGRDISDDKIGVLNATQERDIGSYVGFDFDKTWQMDTQADFFYPTLTEKIAYVIFINENSVFSEDVFGTDGKTTIPEAIPEKPPTFDKSFKFSHWSTTQDGDAFNFDEPVYENTKLYAVFTSSPREYKINFISGDQNYVPEMHVFYGDKATAPQTIPEKPSEGRYYYEFSHWSTSPDSSYKVDFDTYAIYSDTTFYAVFLQFDENMWTGNVANSFASGYGTAEMPYMIERAEELAFLQKVINEQNKEYTNKYFALGDDINLGGNVWNPIGISEQIPFSGHFNGNGFRISNYKVLDTKYAGLFGYVKNANIKNIYLSGFDIDFEVNTPYSDYDVFVGSIAGYVDNVGFDGEISGIRVSANKFEVSGNASHIYAGGIVGWGSAHSRGTTTIRDCFVTSPITVNATAGYAYAGGIAARYETNSASISRIIGCYNLGDISTTSKNTAWAGGLVGYLFSYGSFYVGTMSDEDASLSAEDKDIMIINSFTLSNVSVSTQSFENIGYVVGSISEYADTDTVFYTGEKKLTYNENSNTKPTYVGTKIPSKYFIDKDFVAEQIGFDMENTWTYISGFDYPVLKCTVSSKPGVKIISVSLDEGILDIKAEAFTDSGEYTLVMSIYSSRNQMIKFERIASKDFTEIDRRYQGMETAAYVKLSMISSSNYKPLFEAAAYEL